MPRHHRSRLVIAVALALVLLAACGDDGGDESSTDPTDESPATSESTTDPTDESPATSESTEDPIEDPETADPEPEAADVTGDWIMVQDLLVSSPPDVIPEDGRRLELTLALELGDCPTETTAEGPDAAALADFTVATDPAACVGSADWEQRNGNRLVGVPLLLEGDTYSLSVTLVQPCIDSETGEVLSPTGASSERTLSFTVGTVGDDGAAETLEGAQIAVNALDPVDCSDPVDTFADTTTFAMEAQRA